jgi:hypothetical protein
MMRINTTINETSIIEESTKNRDNIVMIQHALKDLDFSSFSRKASQLSSNLNKSSNKFEMESQETLGNENNILTTKDSRHRDSYFQEEREEEVDTNLKGPFKRNPDNDIYEDGKDKSYSENDISTEHLISNDYLYSRKDSVQTEEDSLDGWDHEMYLTDLAENRKTEVFSNNLFMDFI